MTTVIQQYTELLALAKRHLLEDFKSTDRLPVSTDDYLYFRNYAAAAYGKKPASPQNPPLPPPLPSQQKAVVERIVETPTAKPVTQRTPLPGPKPLPPENTPAEVKKTASNPPSSFSPEHPTPLKPEHFEELRAIAQEKLPHFTYIDKIPDDSEAKLLATAYQHKGIMPEVIILAFSETSKELNFLQNISKTLATYGIHSRVIKAAKVERWENLLSDGAVKIIIGNKQAIETIPLMANAQKPIIKLSDASSYFSNAHLKASLWQTILDLRG